MRLLICGGGTGGGVYPALAVLQALANEAVTVLWVGSQGGMEADLVKREGVDFTTIPAAGVHGVSLRALPGNLSQLARGFRQARRIVKEYQPQAAFFTGGYVAIPMALASRHLPSLLYVPDIEPGLALKFLSRFASQIALTVEESRQYFSSRMPINVVGYPCRADLMSWDVGSARQVLELDDELPTLLVFGGSKGARSINLALLSALEELLVEMQIIHISGQLDWPMVEQIRDQMPPEMIRRYKAFPYLHAEMGAALLTADLAISRAGASSLGEFPLFGLPAVLAPYPHAWRYQYVNARYLASRGAAVMIEDSHLANQLAPIVKDLMHDHQRRRQMSAVMRSLAQPQAAKRLAGILGSMMNKTRPSGSAP